jgi:multiple sugar transport system ATP-binding protein
MVLGVRPEHVFFSDASPLRGEVYGTEYLGTMQIVTVKGRHATLKARLPADVAVRTGETVGLEFRARNLSVFDGSTGRAMHAAVRHG